MTDAELQEMARWLQEHGFRVVHIDCTREEMTVSIGECM